MTDLLTETPRVDDEALDAYSETVIAVAERIVPSVASLRVAARGREGAGSAVVLAADGYLLTSAHVVAGAERGTAVFADWHETSFELVGRDPLSDLAVLRAAGVTGCPRSNSATRTRCAWANWWWRWATRTASPARSPPA